MKMRKISFILLFLLAALYAHGESIHVKEAGSLSTLIGDRKNTITELQLSGSLNGTDIKFIREMVALASVNMRDSKIVSGGEPYDGTYYTQDDVIGGSMFSYMKTWVSVVLPAGVKSMGMAAFAECENLESIALPETVTAIGDECFKNNNKLHNVTIPSGCTVIGASLFYDCSSLKTINIPDGIIHIPRSCFSGCSQLSNIDGCNNVETTDSYAFANCKLTTLPGGSSLKTIGYSAFAYCDSLTSVTIPGSILSIGEYAFQRCSNLKKVIFEEGNTSVGSHMFMQCYQLSEVVLPSTINKIDYGAFAETGIETITLPDGLTDLVEACFYDCLNLVSIDIPAGVTKIGLNMFGGCKKLQTAKIPHTVTYIMEKAFKGCSSLSKVICLNPTPPILGTDVFAGLPLANRNLEVPQGSESLYAVADQWKDFYGEKPTLVIDGKKATVGILTAGTLPEIIGGYVGDIEELIISGPLNGTDLHFIRSMSMDYKLIKLDMAQASIVSGGDAYLVYNNKTYNTSDNVIGASMFWELSHIKSIVLPHSIISIEASAFSDCVELQTVKMSETVTSIGPAAFYSCFQLSDIELPSRISGIAANTFWKCLSLREITIPNGVTAIGTRAFCNTGLQSINIPEGVVNINGLSFSDCAFLTSVTIPKSVTSVGNDTFDGSQSLTSIIWNTSFYIQLFVDLSESNCLLYINSDAAVSHITKINNIIRNGMAENITLISDKPFHCPVSFKTKKVLYEKKFSLNSGLAEAAGWETIVLPFNVESYYNVEKGALAPFSSESIGTKPFWLRTLTNEGFEDVSMLEANKPYIISMPNNAEYDNEYNIVGIVSFTAENVDGITIPTTPQPMYQGEFTDYSLIPTFRSVEASDTVYALNTSVIGSNPAGSVFVRALRDVAPFEAYVVSKEAPAFAPMMYGIGSDGGGITALEQLLLKENRSLKIYSRASVLYIESDRPRLISIYGSDGVLIRSVNIQEGKNVIDNLPTGIYFLEGKKVIIKS